MIILTGTMRGISGFSPFISRVCVFRMYSAYAFQTSMMAALLYHGQERQGRFFKGSGKGTGRLDLYSRPEHKHDLVFPDLESLEDINDQWEVKRKIKSRNKRINEWLDKVKEVVKITKKLDPHIARHTFGNISGDKISFKTLQQLYRHFHLTTTAKYQQNFSYDEMDQALDSVLEEIALAMV